MVKRARTNGGRPGSAKIRRTDGAKALTMIRKLKRQEERKAHLASGEVNTKQVIPLHLIAEGDAGFERDGLAIVAKNIQLTGAVYQKVGSVDTTNAVFVTVHVVKDMQQVNAVTPDYDTIFDGAPRSGVQLDFENHKRFKVLWKRRFVLNFQAVVGNGEMADHAHRAVIFEKNIPLRDLSIRWQAAAASTITKNGLYLCFDLQDAEGAQTAALAEMTYRSRLWFTDP